MSEWSAETAEWYAAAYGEYATNRLAVYALEMAPDAVVVDVGCGTGSALRRIAPRVPQGRLIGLEPTPRMIAIARDRASQDPNGSRIEFVGAAAESMPLESGTADGPFCPFARAGVRPRTASAVAGTRSWPGASMAA